MSYFTSVHKVRGAGGLDPLTKRKGDDIDEEIDVSADSVSPGGDYSSTGSSLELKSVFVALFLTQIIPQVAQIEVEASESTFGVNDEDALRPSRLKRLRTRAVLKDNFGKLQPPLLGPQDLSLSEVYASQSLNVSGTRQRHLAILTTIMHRSLLQCDYSRADRAWSMILRSELDSHSVDLRNGRRWGLGAELLLRRSGHSLEASVEPNSIFEVSHGPAESPRQLFNIECYENVKQYYDRLSLQYPYHKFYPDATGPLDFSFAMFGLWICTCTQQGGASGSVYELSPSSTARRELEQEMTENCRGETLRHARQITERLKELVSSPPFSDSKKFKDLKIMVDAWIGDLAKATDPS